MSAEIETLHKPFRKWLHDAGLVYSYMRPDKRTGAAYPGDPDFTIYRNGRCLLIEMKDKETPVSEDQKIRHADLLAQGSEVYIIRAVEKAVVLTVQWLSMIDVPVTPRAKVEKSNVCRYNGWIYRRGARGGWDKLRVETLDDRTLPTMAEVK